MQPFRRRAGLVVLATIFVHAHALAEDKVEVKVAKYAELTSTINKLKGKVIVVDFWADW
jgi:hypothetical protein